MKIISLLSTFVLFSTSALLDSGKLMQNLLSKGRVVRTRGRRNRLRGYVRNRGTVRLRIFFASLRNHA